MQEMHRWPAAIPLLTFAAAVVVSGCVQVTTGPGANGVGVVSGSGVRWAWFDRNLLRRPALFVERIEHRPPPADRVRHFRWQHGAGADDPLLRYPIAPGYPMPETEVLVETVAESTVMSPADNVPADRAPDGGPPDGGPPDGGPPDGGPPDGGPPPSPLRLAPWPVDVPDVPDVPDAPPSDGSFDGPTASADPADPIQPAGM